MSSDSFFLKRLEKHIADYQNLDVIAFKRFYIYILIFLSILITWAAIILSFYNEVSSIVPVLITASVAFIVAGIIIYIKPHFLLQIQYMVLIICGLLGIAFLTHSGSYDPTFSLVWFVVFASIIMFTLGLYHGTIAFSVYFILLILLFFVPNDIGVNDKIPHSSQIRLLLAMLGTFLYSWGAEYLRHKTHLALTTLLLETEKLANTDSLTGLRNRRNFQNILSNMICVSDSIRQPFALFLIDIDFFKNVNDSYGHDAGDLLLKHFSDTLAQQKRTGDFLFRWGGEEFIMILPGITAANALSLANRMREHIAMQPFEKNTINIPYTISMGIYSGQGKEGNAHILETADINLYKAKHAGRNCVMM